MTQFHAKIQAWGRLSNHSHQLQHLPITLGKTKQVHDTSHDATSHDLIRPGIAHGMGRSYGDVALNAGGTLWLTTGLNHFIHFDLQHGVLHCEAGCTLQDIQRCLVPQGWMLAVSPGTQMITVGGAIANDVHGKNHHHYGSFGDHVIELTLLRSDGDVICCSRSQHAAWFYASLGGIGLTGIILSAKIQMRAIDTPWIESENTPYYSLSDFFALSDAATPHWEHCVSWIDCLNGAQARGIFMRGRSCAADVAPAPSNVKSAQLKSPQIQFAITPPISLVNPLSLRCFNFSYFHRNKHKKQISYFESFFYPLDGLQHWNRMYGPRGFYQYQSLIPHTSAMDATQEMLRQIKKSGQGSFLAVLKTFGPRESGGLLSFARSGVTLALDFPNCGDETLRLLTRLDHIVMEAQGRVYLAKDARMPRALFEAGYPRFQEFLKYKDPAISSDMSRRLLGL